MNETNTEKQLARIADALENFCDIMHRVENIMTLTFLDRKKESNTRNDRRER